MNVDISTKCFLNGSNKYSDANVKVLKQCMPINEINSVFFYSIQTTKFDNLKKMKCFKQSDAYTNIITVTNGYLTNIYKM